MKSTIEEQLKGEVPAREAKYLRLAAELREMVLEGQLKPGDQLPSLTEWRTRRNVGRSTVEKVHSLLEHEGLIVREQGRGTFVCEQPHHRSVGTIGIAGMGETHSDLDVPYFARLLQGIREVAGSQGIEILLLNESSSSAKIGGVDGILYYSDGIEPSRAPHGYRHCVSLVHAVAGVESVIANDHAGAKIATEHLIELGHRRIAHLTTGLGQRILLRRLAGYQAALWDAGIEPDPKWVRTSRIKEGEPNFYYQAGYRHIEDRLRTRARDLGCTAYLTNNDEMAMGVIEALRDAGITVPGEVSVVGFDGTRIGEYCHPKLTSVEVPLREIGARGTELLLRLVREGSGPVRTTVLPVHLKVRASSAPPC